MKKGKLRGYLENFRSGTGSKAQIGVHNILKIIRIARNDYLSGEDLTGLDLRHTSLSGVMFSRDGNMARFDESRISDTNAEAVALAIYLKWTYQKRRHQQPWQTKHHRLH